jgi:hypothetical protein
VRARGRPSWECQHGYISEHFLMSNDTSHSSPPPCAARQPDPVSAAVCPSPHLSGMPPAALRPFRNHHFCPDLVRQVQHGEPMVRQPRPAARFGNRHDVGPHTPCWPSDSTSCNRRTNAVCHTPGSDFHHTPIGMHKEAGGAFSHTDDSTAGICSAVHVECNCATAKTCFPNSDTSSAHHRAALSTSACHKHRVHPRNPAQQHWWPASRIEVLPPRRRRFTMEPPLGPCRPCPPHLR